MRRSTRRTPSTRRSAHHRLKATVSASTSSTIWSMSATCLADNSASIPDSSSAKNGS